jgi:hypothetical protein
MRSSTERSPLEASRRLANECSPPDRSPEVSLLCSRAAAINTYPGPLFANHPMFEVVLCRLFIVPLNAPYMNIQGVSGGIVNI